MDGSGSSLQFDEDFVAAEYALPLQINVGSGFSVSILCFDVVILCRFSQKRGERGA
jgi:hypothetical protein